jgi:hypothetical protein
MGDILKTISYPLPGCSPCQQCLFIVTTPFIPCTRPDLPKNTLDYCLELGIAYARRIFLASQKLPDSLL